MLHAKIGFRMQSWKTWEGLGKRLVVGAEITIYTVILFVEWYQLHDGIHCIINTILQECRVIYSNSLIIIPLNLGSHLWRESWFEDNDGKFACVLAMLPRLLSVSLRLVWLHWLYSKHFLAASAVYCREHWYYINKSCWVSAYRLHHITDS